MPSNPSSVPEIHDDRRGGAAIRSQLTRWSIGGADERLGPAILVLGLLLFAGSFLYAHAFRLYDDDYVAVVPAFFWSKRDLWHQIVSALTQWPQGRPIGVALNSVVAFLTAQSATLATGYASGFCVLLLNGALLYRLAIRFLPVPGALFSAAIYLLYPIDTSKALLMFRVTNHFNVTFLLCALLAYVYGRRVVAYVLATVCFLIYEPFFPIFLIAPLLVSSRREVSLKKVLLHGAIWAGIAGLLLYARLRLGDPRIGESFHDVNETVGRILQALYIGPGMVAISLVRRPLEALLHSDGLQWIVGLFSAVVLYRTFSKEAPSAPANTPLRERSMWMMIAGVAGLFLGYALNFRSDYWPPVMTIGRFSGVHAAGSIGCALAAGGFLTWLGTWVADRRWLLYAGAAAYCGLLVSVGIEVQRVDYLQHAEQQKMFWDQILETSNEWQADTMILVDVSGGDPGRPYTPGNQIWWVVNFAPTMLERLVEWPENWPSAKPETARSSSDRPRVYGFDPGFETISDADGVIVKQPAWLSSAYWPRIADRKFIYFRFVNGRMVRETKPVSIGGRLFTPMEQGSRVQVLRRTGFYEMLFGRKDGWPSIATGRNFPK